MAGNREHGARSKEQGARGREHGAGRTETGDRRREKGEKIPLEDLPDTQNRLYEHKIHLYLVL